MKDNYLITGLIKDWKFRIEEISASHFRMEGHRRSGETVSKEGSNSIHLAREIAKDALELDKKYLNPAKEPFKEYFFNTNLPQVFPPELCEIILEEILLGNWILESWTGFGQGVQLAHPFCIPRNDVRPPLEYHEVNDPHYWKDEVRLRGTDFFVAGSFKR